MGQKLFEDVWFLECKLKLNFGGREGSKLVKKIQISKENCIKSWIKKNIYRKRKANINMYKLV